MTIDRLPCGHHAGAYREKRGLIEGAERPFYGDGPVTLIVEGRCEVCETEVDEIYGRDGWLIRRAVPR